MNKAFKKSKLTNAQPKSWSIFYKRQSMFNLLLVKSIK